MAVAKNVECQFQMVIIIVMCEKIENMCLIMPVLVMNIMKQAEK